MKTNKILVAVMGVALAGFGLNASAATSNATISPSLTIKTVCSVNAGAVNSTFTAQNFGSTASGVAMTGGNIVVTCPSVAYSVGASEGLHPLTATRNLKAAGATLIPYTLSIAGTPWGDNGLNGIDVTYTDGTVVTTAAKAVASGAAGGDTFAITGTVTGALAGTEVVGTYADTVTVTVAW